MLYAHKTVTILMIATTYDYEIQQQTHSLQQCEENGLGTVSPVEPETTEKSVGVHPWGLEPTQLSEACVVVQSVHVVHRESVYQSQVCVLDRERRYLLSREETSVWDHRGSKRVSCYMSWHKPAAEPRKMD